MDVHEGTGNTVTGGKLVDEKRTNANTGYGTRTPCGFPFSNILNVTTFAGAEFSETFASIGRSRSSSPVRTTIGGRPSCVDVWDPSIM